MRTQIEDTVRQLEAAISENNEEKSTSFDTLLMQLSDADIAT